MFTRFAMVSKKSNFAASMRKKNSPQKESSTGREAVQLEEASTPAKGQRAPSRVGKSPLVAYVDKDAIRHVKVYCAREDIPQQKLIIDAINEYLQSRGDPGIL